jgi:DNA-directed RNA polymerase subunit F
MLEKREKDCYTEIKQPLTANLVKNLMHKLQKKPEELLKDASRKSLEHFQGYQKIWER